MYTFEVIDYVPLTHSIMCHAGKNSGLCAHSAITDYEISYIFVHLLVRLPKGKIIQVYFLDDLNSLEVLSKWIQR